MFKKAAEAAFPVLGSVQRPRDAAVATAEVWSSWKHLLFI